MTKETFSRVFTLLWAPFMAYLLLLNIPWLTTAITSLYVMSTVLIFVIFTFLMFIYAYRPDVFKKAITQSSKQYNTYWSIFTILYVFSIIGLTAIYLSNSIIFVCITLSAIMAAAIMQLISSLK